LDREAGIRRAAPAPVDGTGQKFFAGAGFAGDEHRHVGRGHAPDAFQHIEQEGRTPYDAVNNVKGLGLCHSCRSRRRKTQDVMAGHGLLAFVRYVLCHGVLATSI
jgi:hypothetical protein